MVTYYSERQSWHHPQFEFYDGILRSNLDVPERAEIILEIVRSAGIGAVESPSDYGIEPIKAVHDSDYIQYLQTAYAEWLNVGGRPEGVFPDTFPVRRMSHRPSSPAALAGYYSMDVTAIVTAGTWQAAYDSAQCALNAANAVRNGARSAFALCRPPGHHAQADVCGGYCFLNNAAIAAQSLCNTGLGNRIAILDIDFHHGNGTQAIFYERDDVLTLSLHADPDREYPYFTGADIERGEGAGFGYNVNYPLESRVDDHRYMEVLDEACSQIMRYDPSYLVLALGVDTFSDDPLCDFNLTSSVYEVIGSRLAQLMLPTVFIMEGGYATKHLGHNVVNVLVGFESR